MRQLAILLFFLFSHTSAISQSSLMDETNVRNVVKNFIALVKTNDKEKLSKQIAFPFEREYPIPDIKSKPEFFKRYSEVFDDSLARMISDSDPVNDWSAMGWRGIMLMNGEVWLDYDGRLMGINYQSKAEKKIRKTLMENDRSLLHESIRKYSEPVLVLETPKFRIRIDDLGKNMYRYASWPIDKKMSAKPDLVINGEIEFDGNGGNHHYTFKNNDYIYKCSIVVLGTKNSPPAYVTIYKGEKQVLSQKAIIVGK